MEIYLVLICLGFIFSVTSSMTPISYTMREELPVDTVIGNVKTDAVLTNDFRAEDIDRLSFSILTPVDGSHSNGNYFQIEESSGILKVMRLLDRDREDICAFRKRCIIMFDVAVGPEDIFRVITVQVVVDDVNDNTPVFGLNEINLNISELDTIGSSYQLPAVYDPDGDAFGVTKMSVSPAKGQFAVRWMRTSDGRIMPRLELLQSLDREKVTTFDLTISATDGGSPPKSAILLVHVDILDANDNVPRFKERKYEVRVPEDLRTGTTVIQVKADDPDFGNNGRVTYKLGTSTVEQYGELFQISEITGEINVIGNLDREIQDIYYLNVVASDGGDDVRHTSATVTVFVDDVNDNAPVLRISTLTENGVARVIEASPVGTFVALLSIRDLDWGRNANVTCNLNNGNFRLDMLQTNQFKIVTNIDIDRELETNYTIKVFCHDQGFPQKSSVAMVTVQVDDINDNRPTFVFDDVTIHVTENIHPGSIIGQVTASDNDYKDNGLVTYQTLDTLDTYIRVSDDTGVITTITTLDREDIEKFVIYIIARDHGEPSLSSTATVTVIIDDVNDAVPVFNNPSYTFVVVENDGSRRKLGHLAATDRDNPPYNRIQYSLRGQNAYYLDIDPANGTLYAVKPLDRETTSVIHLEAVATDSDNPTFKGLANVTVYVSDVNDHVPKIVFPSLSNNTIEISNQLQAGDVVTTIQATDGDTGQNAMLEYFLTFPQKDDNKFVINRENGIITADSDLSRLDNELVHCTVVVKDGGIPSLVTSTNLTILINSTILLPEPLVDVKGLDINITIVIIVIATTLVLVAILIGAIILVFRKMRRKKNEPMYSVEKMGEFVAKNGQLDIEKQQQQQQQREKIDCNNDLKSGIKILETSRSKTELDRESLGSGEGSTTDSGRGASEEGDHEKNIVSRHDGNADLKSGCPSPNDTTVGSNVSLDHNSTLPKRHLKNKNVTFEDDVMMNKSLPDNENSYSSRSYDSCPVIRFQSPNSVSYTGLEPWSPDENFGQYNVSASHNTPRRTVRNVKAKDRCKKMESLIGNSGQSDSGHMIQSDPTLFSRYDRSNQNRGHYDFADANSLLRYKSQGTDDSMSEITSAASTTSGSYIIENDDPPCNC